MNYYNNPMCHDDCIGCLISECDHNQEYGEAFEEHQELHSKVMEEINHIYDGDVCSPPLRSWDKNGYEFQKFIFQCYLYYKNKYPYRKGDHKFPFE